MTGGRSWPMRGGGVIKNIRPIGSQIFSGQAPFD
jgi:hypothetical protein